MRSINITRLSVKGFLSAVGCHLAWGALVTNLCNELCPGDHRSFTFLYWEKLSYDICFR